DARGDRPGRRARRRRRAAYIPGSDRERNHPGEARAGAARDGGAARRAAAGAGHGVLRRLDPERDRRQDRPAAGHGQDADAARHEEAAQRAASGDPTAPVNEEPTSEDRALLAALAALGPASGQEAPAPPGVGDVPASAAASASAEGG